MKLITLNIWTGRIPSFFAFLETYKDEIDIFCFQECFEEATDADEQHEKETKEKLFTRISAILTEHTGIFSNNLGRNEGNAIFVKKHINHSTVKVHPVHMNEESPVGRGKSLQEIELTIGDKRLTVFNFHGLWAGPGAGKGDMPIRKQQSERMKDILGAVEGAKILCGDFNLSPDTESLALLEEGMRNLIKEYGITSTRTSLYEKENKFADYILVSPEIRVNDFKVLPDEVSDHSPLHLSFEVL